MIPRINKEFRYKNATVVIRDINAVTGDVFVIDVYAGGYGFQISKRTLDGLPEPEDDGGRSGAVACIKMLNDRQRVLLEALQAAEDALKEVIQFDRLHHMGHPSWEMLDGAKRSALFALDAIARTKTPHDDDAVQS